MIRFSQQQKNMPPYLHKNQWGIIYLPETHRHQFCISDFSTLFVWRILYFGHTDCLRHQPTETKQSTETKYWSLASIQLKWKKKKKKKRKEKMGACINYYS